jgi:hypothetical protein
MESKLRESSRRRLKRRRSRGETSSTCVRLSMVSSTSPTFEGVISSV